jgi:hypothetical protein
MRVSSYFVQRLERDRSLSEDPKRIESAIRDIFPKIPSEAAAEIAQHAFKRVRVESYPYLRFLCSCR